MQSNLATYSDTAESTPGCVTLEGNGLHSGKRTRVTLVRTTNAEPVAFRTALGDCPLDRLEIVRADQGVRVRSEATGLDVDGVEHLLAAFGGLSIHAGVAIQVEGTELPLLDGGALEFSRALMTLDVGAMPRRLVIIRAGSVRIGSSTYAFSPGRGVLLDTEIEFAAKAIGTQRAHWHGDPEGFLCDFSWARTFGFRRDAERLNARGRANGVNPKHVMVLDDQGHVEPPGALARPDEFARHKLLDLIGDLYLFGGPPIGHVKALRPGHTATHRAMREALERGIIVKA